MNGNISIFELDFQKKQSQEDLAALEDGLVVLALQTVENGGFALENLNREDFRANAKKLVDSLNSEQNPGKAALFYSPKSHQGTPPKLLTIAFLYFQETSYTKSSIWTAELRTGNEDRADGGSADEVETARAAAHWLARHIVLIRGDFELVTPYATSYLSSIFESFGIFIHSVLLRGEVEKAWTALASVSPQQLFSGANVTLHTLSSDSETSQCLQLIRDHFEGVHPRIDVT